MSSILFIASAVVVLHGPATSMALTGDSYQWIQHAHLAAHRPVHLFADLDTFYRPSTTWTLVADRAVWGGFNARGYRTTSLALHGLAGLILVIAGRRLGLGWTAAIAVGLVWTASPFTDESAFVVAYRFQPLLLSSWLVLIAAWPRGDERWSAARAALAVSAVLGAAAAKETWVVTPALVAALEFERSRSVRSAAAASLAVGTAVAVYLSIYFVAFPTGKSYFDVGPHVAAKIPSQLAAFLLLEESVPDGISLTVWGVIALVVFIAVGAACLRWRVPGALVALSLFLLPTLPTLAVPYMPQRYLAIPYAGFLLLVGLALGGLSERHPRWRPVTRGLGSVTAVLVLAIGASTVRGDLEDHRRMAVAHQRLLDETAVLGPVLEDGLAIAVARDERSSPLLDVARSPVGYPKLVFVRSQDPYGLIDAAALFEWVQGEEGRRVEHVAGWRTAGVDRQGRFLVHRVGGFADRGPTPNLLGDARNWEATGGRLQIVMQVCLERGG